MHSAKSSRKFHFQKTYQHRNINLFLIASLIVLLARLSLFFTRTPLDSILLSGSFWPPCSIRYSDSIRCHDALIKNFCLIRNSISSNIFTRDFSVSLFKSSSAFKETSPDVNSRVSVSRSEMTTNGDVGGSSRNIEAVNDEVGGLKCAKQIVKNY